MRRLFASQKRGIAALTVLAVIMGVLSFAHRGVAAAKVDLNDGGVWVTNNALHLTGHLNYPSRTIDGGLASASSVFDVSQHASTVLLHEDGRSVRPIDTATLALGTGATLADDQVLVQGGTTTAIASPSQGKVWVVAASGLATFSTGSPAAVEGLEGVRVTVTTDGVVLALGTNGSVKRIGLRNGSPTVEDAGRISQVKDLAAAELSAVGHELVVLDRAGDAVRTARGTTALPEAAKAELQDPGPTADVALVSTPAGLQRVRLSGGDPTTTPAAAPGNPIRPVMLNGCAYAAWTGSGAYLRHCDDGSADVTRTIDRIASATTMAFRVNRDVIVLNDLANGVVLLVNDNMRVIDNWQLVRSQAEDASKQDTTRTSDSEEAPQQKRSDKENPPVAQPDEFGVRAGRSTTLPVLANDSDPDGDLLTAEPLTQPSSGAVSQARGGEALRVAVPDGATGTLRSNYRVSDGRGGTDQTGVTLTVHPTSQNEAPKPLRRSQLTVTQGSSGTYSVLPDWIDPDGDAVYLATATAGKDMDVRMRPDGTVTVKDLGTGAPGVREVALTVTDGRKSAKGTLLVNVRPKENQPPAANPDHVVAVKGHSVVVRPLLNDTDPAGKTLRLAAVGKAASGAQITPDLIAGTFTFASDTVGSQYIDYTITDGPSTATGFVRIDVLPGGQHLPPVADNDLALLPQGGSTMADVLANDFDPNGGVLVIQSTAAPTSVRGLSVEVVDHSKLRISAPAGLSQPVDIRYTVSNGDASADAQVSVIPLASGSTTQAPEAHPDAATVRTGDIVTVPVLANDVSPAGLPMELDQRLGVQGDANLGAGFVSGNDLRFRAGAGAGTVRITYTVKDSAGNFASSEAVLTVVAADGHNSPPQPRPLTGRVLAGNTVRIPVPTDGVDPDGDSVTLTGVDTPPSKGVATVQAGRLEYKAPAGAAGTDTFSYAVTDRFGARSVAEVRVGIAPPPGTNQPPVAVPDEVYARPDRELAVPVIRNDVDPEGDTLSLIPDSVQPTDTTTSVAATANGDRVVLTTPHQDSTLRYYYGVTDGKGGQARGVLTVHVAANAPLHPPVARDDVLQPVDIAGKNSVEVDVLANDDDPDGNPSNLRITADEGGASVVNGKVRVPVTKDRQVLLYTVTNADNLASRAAIVVPGSVDLPPTLRADKIPAKVKAGETLTLALGDVVTVRPGHAPRVTFEDRTKAGPGAADPKVVKDATTLQFVAAPDFSGSTAVTFEVTDGATADDPTGLKAVLTLPIEVEASGRTRPELHPSAITVAQNEPAQKIDLTPMVTDPDPGDMERMKYSIGQVSDGLDVRLNGSVLSVAAPAARAGTAGTAQLTVTDGTTLPVSAQLEIRVTASTRPLITIADAVIDNAKAGQASTVDLAKYITDPFAADGKPATLVGQPTVTSGQGTATAQGMTATVTPAATFHGQMVVTYTVQDATQDPGRQVQGTIRLTVRDRPDAPTGVTAETHASRTATVAWTAGANNGSPITAFTVHWSGGQQNCGQTTSCVITGLTNNQTYAFTVTATNAVGDSDPSTASSSVRPDVKPNVPGAPTTVFGDRSATVSWAASTTDGSPVTGYTVEISPAAGGASQRDVAGTSVVWTGLTNGTAYTFRVQAHSSAPDPSDWSGTSAPVIPAGLPAAPAAPQAVMKPASTLEPSATVSWTAPDGNGDNNMTYELRVSGGATAWTGTGTSASLTLAVASTDKTFEVRAQNKAGWGPWSPVSNAVRAFQTPGAVTNLAATPTGANNTATVTFDAAAGNGATAAEISYLWQAGGATGTLPAGGGAISNPALQNGTPVSISVRARSTVKGETVDGPASTTTVTAYGPPVSPSVSCSAGLQDVSCSWSGGNANGRNTTYQLSGDTSGSGGASGNYAFTGIGPSATRTLCVQAVQDGGQVGARNCAAATSQPSSYDWAPTRSPTPNGWYYVNLKLTNYRPNSTVHCYVGGIGAPDWAGDIAVDGAGNFGPARPRNAANYYPTAASDFVVDHGFGTCTQN